jgi:hypothetical protein
LPNRPTLANAFNFIVPDQDTEATNSENLDNRYNNVFYHNINNGFYTLNYDFNHQFLNYSTKEVSPVSNLNTYNSPYVNTLDLDQAVNLSSLIPITFLNSTNYNSYRTNRSYNQFKSGSSVNYNFSKLAIPKNDNFVTSVVAGSQTAIGTNGNKTNTSTYINFGNTDNPFVYSEDAFKSDLLDRRKYYGYSNGHRIYRWTIDNDQVRCTGYSNIVANQHVMGDFLYNFQNVFS